MPAERLDLKARFAQASDLTAGSPAAIPSPGSTKAASSVVQDGTTNRTPATTATTAADLQASTSLDGSSTNPISSAQSGSSTNSAFSTSGTKSEPSAKLESTTKPESCTRPESSKKFESVKKYGPTQSPTFSPTASYLPVQVVPATELSAAPTHSSISRYEGSNAIILKGYCTEPDYTILDGPTVLWVPVVGCISSKADCCPTPTAERGGDVASTPKQQTVGSSTSPSASAGQAGKGAFPESSLPSQGSLTGCPQDYHTVTGTGGAACCPSSYWLWSTQLGGQVPCYSSLGQALVPPPIPNTLVNLGRMTGAGSLTAAPSSRTAWETQKPTSAVVNIAYAMQYKLAAKTDHQSTGMKKEAKVGAGAGVAGISLLIAAVLGFFLWRRLKQKKNRREFDISSASEGFSSQIHMVQIAHEQPGLAKAHGDVKYTGVSTRSVDY